jgi:hypothetical protein
MPLVGRSTKYPIWCTSIDVNLVMGYFEYLKTEVSLDSQSEKNIYNEMG